MGDRFTASSNTYSKKNVLLNTTAGLSSRLQEDDSRSLSDSVVYTFTDLRRLRRRPKTNWMLILLEFAQ
ncbi:hypothetical protein KIN20_017818 [Parelaphostrongylus tenuis]|uniref:Uncharacterized protein n=1 Tax=Parelaphostrongylus tenuis TaxID=148309 RepID=A0AAD5MIF1_PARTN|nr:hypothetical protein KIN20_017818 [Parelaphostrongylus tenuis]